MMSRVSTEMEAYIQTELLKRVPCGRTLGHGERCSHPDYCCDGCQALYDVAEKLRDMVKGVSAFSTVDIQLVAACRGMFNPEFVANPMDFYRHILKRSHGLLRSWAEEQITPAVVKLVLQDLLSRLYSQVYGPPSAAVVVGQRNVGDLARSIAEISDECIAQLISTQDFIDALSLLEPDSPLSVRFSPEWEVLPLSPSTTTT